MRAPSVVLVLLVGCGAASAGLVPLERRPPAPSACVVRGSAPEVPLRLDALAFPIELAGTARYVLSAGSEVSVHAEGPLELSARAALDDVPLSLGPALDTPVLDAEAGTALSDVVFAAGRLVATLAIDVEVQVRAPLGCQDVAVGLGDRPMGGSFPRSRHELVGDGPLPIAASPGGAPLALVLAPAGSRWTVVAQAGARMRIVRELERGSIDGWVDAARLTLVSSPHGGGYATGYARCGGASASVVGRSFAGLLYEGPARLRPGAVLRGEGGALAARARAEVEVRVRIVAGAEPAVLSVSGLTSGGRPELPEGLTVALDGLALPPGALP